MFMAKAFRPACTRPSGRLAQLIMQVQDTGAQVQEVLRNICKSAPASCTMIVHIS